MSRLRTASRLAAALLATTCLTPIVVIAASAPALADGGQGSGGSAGGADSIGGAGGTGASSPSGGGGGGAGATGGNGGTGSGGSLGGNGGVSPGAGGQSVAGSGGGGGGAHGEVVSAPGAIGAATGGTGGSSGLGGGGGGGGAGGYGAAVTGSGVFTNSGIVSGGSGGSSSSGLGGGGAGGYGAAVTGSGVFTNSGIVSGGSGGSGAGGGGGGIGIAFGASGATLDNSGSIFGGTGGQGFLAGGNGGVGVSGADLGINNTGTIGGGTGGEGIPAANGGAGISGSRLTINNSVGASISGGVGGLGNESHAGTGGAGIDGSSSTVTNSGSIAGGAGGAFDGNGGAGISGSGLTITNTTTGSITGGFGSAGGSGGAGISASSTTVINSGSITGSGTANAITFTGGTNVLELQAGSTITGNVVAFSSADTLRLGGSTSSSFDVSQIGSAAQYRNFGQFEKTGTSTWTLTGTPGQATSWTISQGALAVSDPNSLGSGPLTLNGGALQAATALNVSNAIVLSGTGGTLDTNGNDVTLAGAITGSAGLTKTGTGTLFLDGASSYAGTTSINQGRLAAGTGTFSANSTYAIAAGATLDLVGANQTIGALTGNGTVTNAIAAATLTVGANGASTTFDGVLQDGLSILSLTKTGSGQLNLTGANTYTGPTSVLGGTLAVNGSITSDVTVGAAGTLGGNGTINGSVTNNGTVAPGNSIGTLTVNGSYTQAAGSTYQVELNSAGQNDRLNVTGAPGTATLNGGTVQVLAQAGTYGRTTTYTILNATGGVTGTFAGVTSNFAFLRPSLAYDADDVFLTLTLQGFTFGSLTPNQRAVGNVLDRSFADASGDFATVLGTIAGLDTVQGPKALNALSGESYADFGTVNVAATASFMNAVGQQTSAARGTPANGTRQALALACDTDACDATRPWGTWVSALGGLGSVQGDGNASTLTYNFGGAAAGLDYRVDPRFLVGVAAGFTSGSLWVDSFQGRGWSNSVAIAAYGSFTQAAWYVDALAGYAHFDNRLQRQISFPGVQRTANGSTQANQAFGQVEAGYKLPTGIASTSVTPFARLQLSTTTQDGFSEWGASSIDLAVAAQTTTSARGVLGVDLAGSFDIGDTRTLDLDLRLGWSHEYADTSRPMTAAFAGAPGNPFTVYGATPARDAAALGFQARTKVSDQAQLYLRYDGELSSQSDTHTLNAGVRFVW